MYLIFLCLFFTWMAIQNLILPWVYRQQLLPAPAVGILMASKEAILVLAIALLGYRACQKDWRMNVPDKFALAYTGLLTMYLLCGPWLLQVSTPWALRMISVRSLVSFALFYFLGRLSFLSIRELRYFIRFVVGLQVSAALFGIFEWFFLPTSFWSETIGAGTFMLDIKGLLENQNVVEGLPSNMFRFGIRRAISSYGDPLAMGIASVFPLLLCAAWLITRSKNRGPAASRVRWCAATIVIAAGLLLTLGRESIGAALLGMMFLLWWSGSARKIVVPGMIGVIVLLLLPQVWNYVEDTVTFKEASAYTHLRFLQSGWAQVPNMLIGKGLGEAGGWAFSLAGVQSEAGENSYFELMSQAGAASVFLLGGFLFTAGKSAFRYAREISDPLISTVLLASAAHIAVRSIAAVFSPSLFGVVPLASFFFLCGAVFTAMQRISSQPHAVARRILVLQEATSSLFAGPGV